jgi:hypothetical protein
MSSKPRRSDSAKHRQRQRRRQLRREKVRVLHFQCLSAAEIARQLNTPVWTIYRDLAYFERQYREALPHVGPSSLAEELDRLRHLESEAWKAWQRSQQDETIEKSTIEEGDKPKAKAEKTTRSQVGDQNFLEMISKLAIRRCQLMTNNQAGTLDDQVILFQFEQIRQQRDALGEALEKVLGPGGLENVYACALRQDGQPRALEDGRASGDTRSGNHGSGIGSPIEVDRANAAETRKI